MAILRRLRWLLLPLTLLVIISANALTAANTVATSGLEDTSMGVSVQDKAPPECAGMGLTNIIDEPNAYSLLFQVWYYQGTPGNDLLLGNATGHTMIGAGGNDCILGGGGNDTIWGDQWLFGGTGIDVCIGGPPDGPGDGDTFNSCEVQIQ